MGLSAAPLGSRVRKMQRLGLTLVVITGIFNYFDRVALSFANPLIRKDLHLSMGQMGLLFSAFFWSYAFAQLPMGALIDRIGSRVLLAVGVCFWSVAQGFTGMVNSLSAFLGLRVALGIGETPQQPASARMVQDWFNIKDRGLASGIFVANMNVGAVIAPPILTGVMLVFGWRWLFGGLGIVGVLIAVLWYACYRDPAQVSLTDEEREYLVRGDPQTTRKRMNLGEWGRLFRHRTTWGMMIGFFGVIYLDWLFRAWLPGYLESEHHLSIKLTGWIACIPFIFAGIGNVSGGWFADRLYARGVSAVNSRKTGIVGGVFLFAASTAGAALTHSTVIALTFVTVGIFFGGVAIANAWALTSVAAPANGVASLAGIQNFGGQLGGAFAPLITGYSVQATHSFTFAFMLGAVIGLVSAIACLILVRDPIPPETISSGTLAAVSTGNP
jgi:MFS family permease